MEIAEYIIRILRTQIVVVMSWGFHKAKAIENGLAFMVQGFKFSGRVEVIYDEGWDLFDIRLLNEDGSIRKQVEGVFVDGVVSTIDNLVEHCSNYEERVRSEYAIVLKK